MAGRDTGRTAVLRAARVNVGWTEPAALEKGGNPSSPSSLEKLQKVPGGREET